MLEETDAHKNKETHFTCLETELWWEIS